MAVDPYPAVLARHPMAAGPYRAGVRCDDVASGDPDILDAVPRPIAGLPDITGARVPAGAGGATPTQNPTRANAGAAVANSSPAMKTRGEDSPSAHGMASHSTRPRCRGRRVATLTTVNYSRDFPINQRRAERISVQVISVHARPYAESTKKQSSCTKSYYRIGRGHGNPHDEVFRQPHATDLDVPFPLA
jgi:hypothetical protein